MALTLKDLLGFETIAIFEDENSEHFAMVKEFEEANARYKKQYPRGFASDHNVLRKALTLFKNKKYKKAGELMDGADTFVRELVPQKVWNKMREAERAPGMSAKAKAADTNQSDSEYIKQRQAHERLKNLHDKMKEWK